MKDFYRENYSKYFEQTFNIDPSSFLSSLEAKLAPGAFVIDVGCGSGRDLLWLKNRGFPVMGFERSPELAGLARKSTGQMLIRFTLPQVSCPDQEPPESPFYQP